MAKKVKPVAKSKAIDLDRMTECIREIKEREQVKKQLEEEIEEYKNEIKAVMEEHDLDRMECDVFTVKYQEISSDRVDAVKLREKHPSIFKRFLKTVTYKKLTIS